MSSIVTRAAAFPVKHPSAALLFVQILGILLYPLMEDTSAERALFGVIGLLVLGAALYVVKRGPWLTGFAVVLALPVVVLSIWLAFDFDPRRMVVMAALEAMFYFYAAGSLIAYMLEDEFASVDELFAVGRRSRCSRGHSPMCTWCARPCCRVVLAPSRTRATHARGWSCSS